MSAKNYDEKIVKASHSVWEVMHQEATKRGMALTREKEYGDGRVIIGTIGLFITSLNKERDWGLNENEVDLVRRYLRASGNVVNLGKIRQYNFRIFIAEQWSNAALVPAATKESTNRRSQNISPSALGEDREPSPVVYKCSQCGVEKSNQQALNAHMNAHKSVTGESASEKIAEGSDFIISESMYRIMKVTWALGGEVHDSNGRVKRKYEPEDPNINMSTFSSTVQSLVSRGWVEREGNSKRTRTVRLTDAGYNAMKSINQYRAAVYPIDEYLRQVGDVTSNTRNGANNKISDALGLVPSRARRALHDLEERGYVTRGWVGSKYVIESTNPDEMERKPFVKPETSEPAPITHGDEKQQVESAFSDSILKNIVSDDALITELSARLKAAASVDEVEQLKQRMELIESLVNEATEGKMSPLKALAEIQEAVKL